MIGRLQPSKAGDGLAIDNAKIKPPSLQNPSAALRWAHSGDTSGTCPEACLEFFIGRKSEYLLVSYE